MFQKKIEKTMREKHTFLVRKKPHGKMFFFLKKKPLQKIRKKNLQKKNIRNNLEKQTLNRSLNVNPLGKNPSKKKKFLFQKKVEKKNFEKKNPSKKTQKKNCGKNNFFLKKNSPLLKKKALDKQILLAEKNKLF